MSGMVFRFISGGAVLGLLFALTVRVTPKRVVPTPVLDLEPQEAPELLSLAIQATPFSGRPPPVPSTKTADAPEVLKPDLAHRLRLAGTASQPSLVAWMEERQTRQIHRYAQGETVLGARLVLIGAGIVWLEWEGTLTQLRLEGGVPSSLAGAGDPDPAPTPFRFQSGERQGLPRGLLVESTQKAPWLRRLGLRPGDLILEINGQRLITAQQAMQVIRKAIHRGRVTLCFQRAGQIQTVTRQGSPAT